MNELALFAGIGGGILGGALLGWDCIGAVEIEEYPRQVLLARQRDGILPQFPIWDDVRSFDGKPWRGLVDVVSGGFPCQDISAAGHGAGLDGERSGLWREMHRIIGEIRPPFAFMENSPRLVDRGLDRVLADLAQIGYDAGWLCLSASDCGAPHHRERIWILAREMADTDRIGSDTREIAVHLPGETLEEASRRRAWRANRLACDVRAYDTPPPWTPQPGISFVADGVPNRMERLAAVGNGQVPIVAAAAFRALYQAMTGQEYEF